MKRLLVTVTLGLALALSGAADAGKRKSKRAKNVSTVVEAQPKADELVVLGTWEAQYSDEQKRLLDIMIRALEGPDFTDEEFEKLGLTDEDKMYIAMMQMVRNMDAESEERQNFDAQIESMKKTPVVTFYEDHMEVSLGEEIRTLTYSLTRTENGNYQLVTSFEGVEDSEESIVEVVDATTMIMRGPDGQSMTLNRQVTPPVESTDGAEAPQ